MVLIVLASVLSIFLYRATLDSIWGDRFCAFLNALQIKVMNQIYKVVATKLTNWENHEIDTHYNTALASKLFLFQFFNSYNSLFYIAFLKGHIEGCANDDCMKELETQIAVIFITNLFLNAVELGLPFAFFKYRMWNEERNIAKKMKQNPTLITRTEMTYTEFQSKLSPYETPMWDYMELVIQYGYVILFSAAFTLAPLLAFALNLFEIRVDAYKYSYLVRRPFPQPQENIGIWFVIIQAIAYSGIVTNVAIAIFTAHIFDTSLEEKWIIFLLIEHALLLFKFLQSSAIPDTPFIVKQAKIWQARRVAEKMYNKCVTTEDERLQRNLHFTESGADKIGLKEEEIDEDNIN